MAVRNYDIGKFERNYNSHSNNILDSLARMEQKAKDTGIDFNEACEILGFDPLSYQLDNKKYDGCMEESENAVIEGLKKLGATTVAQEHNKYGGIGKILPEFLKNDYAIFNFFGGPKHLPADGGEPVKRKEITLKEDMSIFDRIYQGIKKYKAPLSVGALAIFGMYIGTAYVNASKTEHGDDTDTGIAKAKAEIGAGGGVIIGGDAINASVNASVATATPTPAQMPEKYVLHYGNIDIIGTKQFIKDIVMVNEFAKKCCIEDYEFIVNTKENTAIEESTSPKGRFEVPSAGHGPIHLGQNYLDNRLRGKDVPFRDNPNLKGVINDLPDIIESESHETVHNVEFNNKEKYSELQSIAQNYINSQKLSVGEFDAEAVAGVLGYESELNASKVPQSEIDKFVDNYDFSEFENQIQVYK